jgi:hypothetical protein
MGGVALLACSGGSPAAPTSMASMSPGLSVSIATPQTFDGFCGWHSAVATPSGSTPLGVHGSEPMTVYWKSSPPHGATQFPVGTTILKETTEADAGARTVFAMVKRTTDVGGYNVDGAQGWEWFSLEDNGDCTATILWRGPQAPTLTTYSDLLVGDCNGCHAKAESNDFVWDTALQLSGF